MERDWQYNHNEMCAHFSPKTGKTQSLRIHSENTAKLCREADAAVIFPTLAYLVGLLHDMGKGTQAFQNYLSGASDHPNHAATGAIYCWERWREQDALTAQMLALCICAHHTGLPDCLNSDGGSEFLEKVSEKEKKCLYYEEAVRFFETGIASREETEKLFAGASAEVAAWKERTSKSFDKSCAVRLLLSVLVDADRLDSACFEYGESPFSDRTMPDWDSMLSSLQAHMKERFSLKTELDRLRSDISDACAARAKGERGLFRLSVPTGGGKTLTSLRFALIHAKKHSLKRIFYIIPFNTILDQNAEDIQKALSVSTSVLVHHADIVKAEEEEDKCYRRLTERWDSEIILTSLVQFMNSLFLGKNTNARRMKQLTDSVLVFDEIQSLPVKCRVMFEKAVLFLVNECRCTAVLCTATQPEWNSKDFCPTELIESKEELFRKLERVRFHPETDGIDCFAAAEKLRDLLNARRAVLCVVNAKKVAWDLYAKTRALLEKDGWMICPLPFGMKKEELEQRASQCTSNKILCIHLSTSLCPAHRLDLIHAIKVWTEKKKPILCVSTALIEAGINVSFPVVVRSMTGLPSVIQAGGRCNRNLEAERGDVYLWRLTDEAEPMKYLPEIQTGANILSGMLDPQTYEYYHRPDLLGMPEAIKKYFDLEKKRYDDDMVKYPLCGETIFSLLSNNNKRVTNARSLKDPGPASLPLRQSFRTAGEAFRVIDKKTMGVLVPFGRGEELIGLLTDKPGMQEKRRYLREAQAYSVELYEDQFRDFVQRKIVTEVGDSGVYVLRKEYYDREGGVAMTPTEMELYYI